MVRFEAVWTHVIATERGRVRASVTIDTQFNRAAFSTGERAAKGLIKGGHVTEGLLNKVEMAFRACDPCLGCATHSLPGHLPLQVNIYDSRHNLVQQLVQS